VAEPELLEVVVKETETVSMDVLSLSLVPVDGGTLPPWEPGAHVDIRLPSGLVRSYSVCGDLDDLSQYRVAVLRVRDGRGGSYEIHETDWTGTRPAKTQRTLHITPPRNNFPVVPAREYLFLAGGIGITPLLPMVRQVARQGQAWRLVYGGRTVESMAFVAELRDVPGGTVTLVPQDVAGLIDVAALFDTLPDECEVYACGPAGLLETAQREASRIGARSRLHLERFAASDSVSSADNTAFDVELHRSGRTIHVGADETILQKVLEVLAGQAWSCQEGICGSCETTVLDGDVEHRDDILDDAEREANESMFICVSRCRGPLLVLDL
jgi:ferredoxin-NADP reductase